MKFLALISAFFTVQATAQTSAAISEYISNYQALAIEEQIRTGIPAAITLAQGIHESGAGQGDLALRSNNHFGIKCKNTWNGPKVYHDDDAAGECFRAYTSVAESYKDHSDFLKNGQRYSFLFKIDPKDYQGWAKGLKLAGYATNPKYPQIIIRIIEENQLQESTMAALDKNGQPYEKPVLAANTSQPAATAQPVVYTETKEATLAEPVKEEKNAESKSRINGIEKPGNVEIFTINRCKVLVAESGTSLKKLAKQVGIAYSELLSYNDMQTKDKITDDQLVFLEEKKNKGANKTHEVKKNESAWSISQQEGMKLDNLLAYNRLEPGTKLKAGQLLYLTKKAPR